ncbi:MAG TPA: DUF1844 domain-containing protein [Vicinamibacteria bacterium]|nr:DUF1844 domain-containing protein [Vicinamibacteria bacterium]
MSEESKGFTVNDRRHFTADGTPRAEGTSRGDPEAGPVRSAGEPSPTAPEGVDFGSFLLSLAGQASVLLGAGGEKGEEARKADLDGARQVISILEMLKDKTEGRRTPEEDQLLEGILYELRMAWVARARAGVA